MTDQLVACLCLPTSTLEENDRGRTEQSAALGLKLWKALTNLRDMTAFGDLSCYRIGLETATSIRDPHSSIPPAMANSDASADSVQWSICK